MTISLAKELIYRESITPNDAGCQRFIADRLENSGFIAKHLRFDDVDNLWLCRGNTAPVFTFLGHTDVVSPGSEEEWQIAPFTPAVHEGFLYGRGAADMKGSVAAMVTAMERFIAYCPKHNGTLGLLLTSDEEGIAQNGIRKVVEYFQQQEIDISWCLVGEPSSRSKLGDVIKVGRRGSLTGRVKVHGIQGHVAYHDSAENPIHLVTPAVSELCQTVWDHGNEYYPPTSFQISNINAGSGTDNIIPGDVEIVFNIRYSTEFKDDELIEIVHEILNHHHLNYEVDWHSSGSPFLTESGRLVESVKRAIKKVVGEEPEASTEGGTSDGRFIAPMGAEVIELGPVNATIHKVDERVNIEELETLSSIYEEILQDLLGN